MKPTQPRGYLDRYPAKMVSRLAKVLVNRHCRNCTKLLDPFCGSGAILRAAGESGISAVGWDLNPYATLLSRVKIDGFDAAAAVRLASDCIAKAKSPQAPRLTVSLEGIEYWFTPKTLDKFESLRAQLVRVKAHASPEGRALVLACALSVRLCSRADQRSPKPFISSLARKARKSRHYDPHSKTVAILTLLGKYYSPSKSTRASIRAIDARRAATSKDPSITHVVTSPPYLNAQDYYRNFKLELAILEGILPFRSRDIQSRMIGTERGILEPTLTKSVHDLVGSVIKGWDGFTKRRPRAAWIISKYARDMRDVFASVDTHLIPGGRVVIVCGDNLIAGLRVPTSAILQQILTLTLGYKLVSKERDRIRRRYLAPQRQGHKSIIKTELISVFRKPVRPRRPTRNRLAA